MLREGIGGGLYGSTGGRGRRRYLSDTIGGVGSPRDVGMGGGGSAGGEIGKWGGGFEPTGGLSLCGTDGGGEATGRRGTSLCGAAGGGGEVIGGGGFELGGAASLWGMVGGGGEVRGGWGAVRSPRAGT